MRDFARRRKTDMQGIGSLAEGGRELDDFIDNAIVRHSREPENDYVFDSRMAWAFVEDCLKVHLEVTLHEAAIRAISRPGSGEEQYENIELAKSGLTARRSSEVTRYKKYYDHEIQKITNYDLVVFTDNLSANDVYRTIITAEESNVSGLRMFASPLSLIPTQSIRHIDEQGVRRGSYDVSNPIEVLYQDGALYIADGHNRVATAILQGISTLSLFLRPSSAGPLDTFALTQDSRLTSFVADWEDAFGIHVTATANSH